MLGRVGCGRGLVLYPLHEIFSCSSREYHSSDDWLDVATYWMGLESDVGIKEDGIDVE